MNCTFFGHRYVADDIDETLREVLINLIENKGVKKFYIGNNGGFDSLVKEMIISMKKVYPHIEYYIVLAYIPTENGSDFNNYYVNSIYPDGMEKVPPKFAIIARNKWMVNKSDFVITYVKRSIGGAAQFEEYANKRGKNVINIWKLYLGI